MKINDTTARHLLDPNVLCIVVRGDEADADRTTAVARLMAQFCTRDEWAQSWTHGDNVLAYYVADERSMDALGIHLGLAHDKNAHRYGGVMTGDHLRTLVLRGNPTLEHFERRMTLVCAEAPQTVSS